MPLHPSFSSQRSVIRDQISGDVRALVDEAQKNGYYPQKIILGYMVNSHMGRPVFSDGEEMYDLKIQISMDQFMQISIEGANDRNDIRLFTTSW